MMQDADHKSEQSAQIIRQHTEQIEGFFKGMVDKVKHTLETLGSIEWFKESLHGFSAYEENLIRLKTAIEGNGKAVQPTLEKYKAFAAEISHHTLVTNGEVLALAKQAEQMGFSGEKAEKLIKDSVGLASATEMSAEHAMLLTIALERNNVQLLRRVPQLRGIKDETKLVQQAEKLMTQGLKVAGELSNTAAGQITHLQHEVHGLLRELGGLVAGGIKPVIEWIRKGVDWFKSLDKSVRIAALALPGLIAAFKGLPAILGLLGSLFSPVLALFSGTGIVLTEIGIGVTLLVNKLGGFSAVWDMIQSAASSAWNTIKTKTAEFIHWCQPITQALLSLWTEVWGDISPLVAAGWEEVKRLFQVGVAFINALLIVVGVQWKGTWDGIRDAVSTAILFIEFSIQNWQQVTMTAALAVALGFSKAFDTIRESGVLLIGSMMGVSSAIGSIFTDLWEAIKHPSIEAFKSIGNGAAQAFNVAFATTAAKYGLGESPLTKQIRAGYEVQKALTSQSFDEFKQMKLQQFNFTDETEEKADAVKEKEFKRDQDRRQEEFKEIHKFDQALSNSVEARARIAEQKDRLDKRNEGSISKKNEPTGSITGSSRRDPEALKKIDESNSLLKQINGNIAKGLKGGIKLEPADLGW